MFKSPYLSISNVESASRSSSSCQFQGKSHSAALTGPEAEKSFDKPWDCSFFCGPNAKKSDALAKQQRKRPRAGEVEDEASDDEDEDDMPKKSKGKGKQKASVSKLAKPGNAFHFLPHLPFEAVVSELGK